VAHDGECVIVRSCISRHTAIYAITVFTAGDITDRTRAREII
jgi:hypothetical protein